MIKLSDLAGRPDFLLGPIMVSPSRRLIKGPAGNSTVEPRTMQVFVLLADAREKVVSRATLFEEVWSGAMVGDDSLNRAVAKLRQALDQAAPGLCSIETIPRTGYRLFGEAIVESPAGPQFSLSSDPNRRLVIGGIAVATTAGLGTWVYRASRPDPRVTALVDQADQTLRYAIPDTNFKAVDALRQAVAIDPRNSRAWGLLSYAYANASEDVPAPRDSVPAAERAIHTALHLNPRDANALLARYIISSAMRDWIETDANLRRVLTIDPRNTIAMRQMVQFTQSAGLDEESWDWNERAIAIDPLAPVHQFRRALKHWISGRIGEADVTIDRLMRLWPRHFQVWSARFLIYAFSGRPGAAMAMLDDDANRPKSISAAAAATWNISLIALENRSPTNLAAARAANLATARQGPGFAAYGSMLLGALNEVDASFAIIEGVLQARGAVLQQPGDPRSFGNSPGWSATQWLFTPPMKAVRADPRFAALCNAIGLTAYWAKRGVIPTYRRPRSA